MGFLRRLLVRFSRADHTRKAGRAQLRAAKRNEGCEPFLGLASSYLDLSLVFFGTSFSEPGATRFDRVTQIFQALWRHLRYAERLSDFEYMLVRGLLESCPEKAPITSGDPLVTKLRLLSPQARLAIIAHELMNWPVRYVCLVMRIRTKALHRLLAEARCELCGISWDSLANEERDCLEAISASLSSCPNPETNRALNRRAEAFPRVAEIKACWLELRPRLVEVRMRYAADGAEREALLQRILGAASETPLLRPAIVDRILNTVHFSRHGRIKVS